MEKKIETTDTVKKAIDSLSNMVFGLALSIGTVALITSASATQQQITSGIETFAFSFILIIYAWFRYTKVFGIIKVESQAVMNLNIVLLFFIVIEPYTYALLQSSSAALIGFTSMLFALDMAAIMLVLATLYFFALKQHRGEKSKELETYAHIGQGLFLAGAVFAVSLALPTGLRIDAWFVSAIIGIFFRRFIGFLRQ